MDKPTKEDHKAFKEGLDSITRDNPVINYYPEIKGHFKEVQRWFEGKFGSEENRNNKPTETSKII